MTSRSSPTRARSKQRFRPWSISTVRARRARRGTPNSRSIRLAFSYQPGDAIGLVPENDPLLVDELLKTVGLGSDAALLLKLQKSYDVTTLSRSLVENYAKVTGRGDVKALLEGEAYPKFAADRQLIDLFEAYPEKLDGRPVDGLAAAAAGPALLGCFEPQGASGRSASSGRRGALGIARQGAQGRRRPPISPSGARSARRRALRQAEPALPPAAPTATRRSS